MSQAPPVVTEEGWTELPVMKARSGRSFVIDETSPDRLRVAYFRRDSDGALMGRIWFGPGCEGPPGHAHGGSMAAVLDDAIGKVAWIAGHRVVAATLNVHFRQMLPIGTDARLEAWVDRIDGRKVFTKGTLTGPGGTLFCEADALFIELDQKTLERLAESAG